MAWTGRPGGLAGRRTLAAAGLVVAGVAVLCGALAVGACLADLPPAAADGGDAGPTAPPACGDGILQRDAGEACDPGDSGAPGCDPVSCAIVCPDPGFVGSTNDHCYFPLDAGKISFSAATAACAAQGAHVVTYDGPREQALVDDHFGDAVGPYWLGLQVVMPVDAKPVYDMGTINEPGWRSSCSGCYGPTPTDGGIEFLNLCKVTTIGACVAHSASTPADFGFNCDGACPDASGPAAAAVVHDLCEREPPGLTGQACDDGAVCITLKSSGSFYELTSTPLTRPDAATACQRKIGPGNAAGHLVVFQTPEERAQLSAELVARTPPGQPVLEYWVGLSNPSTTSVPAWTWDDGAAVGAYPLEWADGEPSPSTYPWAYGRVDVDTDDTLFDRQLLLADTGDDTRPFVCEFDGPDGGTP